MQGPDTIQVSPEKARELLPLPYVYKGLSVQGVNPTRLTRYPNQNITVPDEVGRAIVLRDVARRLIGSETAIARVGLGLRPAGRTVAAHVQAAIFFAGLAQKVANSPDPPLLTPKPAPRSKTVDWPRRDEPVVIVEESPDLDVEL